MSLKRVLLIGPLFFILGILIAGIIKFNFVDVPYVGDPRTYISPQTGETIIVHDKADDSVSVRFMEYDDVHLKGFEARPAISASGARYQSRNKRFVFWSKGDEAMIEVDSNKVFQGVVADIKPYAGKLILGHESHTFQPCGSSEYIWVNDAHNLLQADYDALTKDLPPYSEVYAEIEGAVLSVGDDVDGFAADFDTEIWVKIRRKLESLTSQCAAQIGTETIYFSEADSTWRDDVGVCQTCTPENGFGANGTVNNIAWREIWLSLKNDAGENPDIEEVRSLLAAQYADGSGRYPVHIKIVDDIYRINVPVPAELNDMDFLDPRGSLLATYDVTEHSLKSD